MHPLTKYFQDSQKNRQTGCIGLEVEHFILHKETGIPMPYDEISQLMEYLAEFFEQKFYEEENLIALESKEALITLEPGCQLEISITCLQDLRKIQAIYQDVLSHILSYLNKTDYELIYSGGLPTVGADKVQRIDKKRYEYMERYFLKKGSRGLEMMKATAAVHVSVDYFDESDFVKKYRMANILHPIFAFLCSNTAYYAGKQNDDLLLRDDIWQNTDKARCGILPSLFDKDLGYHSYTEWLLQVPLILMFDGQHFLSTGDKTLQEVGEEYGWTKEYIRHYLSMSFLDVRLKQFIEIRSADSMPLDFILAYCALIKGLFYTLENIEKYSKLTDSIDMIKLSKRNIKKFDWDSIVYGQNIDKLCMNMLEDAKKGLNADEIRYLEKFRKLIMDKTHIYKEIKYELHKKDDGLYK